MSRAPTLTTPAAGTLVLLRMGATSVLAPQALVHSVAPRSEVRPAQVGAPPLIPAAGRHWPVYSLDEDLAPLAEPPAGRRICVLLRAGPDLLGLLVDEVVPWTGRAWQGSELPPCMRVPGSPINALAVEGERVYGVLSVPVLAASLPAACAERRHELGEAG